MDNIAFTQTDVSSLLNKVHDLMTRWDTIEPNARRRGLHTLKGTANTFGLREIGLKFHQAEELAHVPLNETLLSSISQDIAKSIGNFPVGNRVERTTEDLNLLWSMLQCVYAQLDASGSLNNDLLFLKQELEKQIEFTEQFSQNLKQAILTHWQYRWQKTFDKAASSFNEKTILLNIELNNSVNDYMLDFTFMDSLFSVVEHLIRNAVVHGIEGAAIRKFNNKPAQGTINLSISIKNGILCIVCQDDGKGFVGNNGSNEVTILSGRGIGLSAVREVAEKLGGNIGIQSDKTGKGSSVQIKVPVTDVRINKSLIWSNTVSLSAIHTDWVEEIQYDNGKPVIILKDEQCHHERIEASEIVGVRWVKCQRNSLLHQNTYFNYLGRAGCLHQRKAPTQAFKKPCVFVIEDAPEQRLVIVRFLNKMYPACDIAEFDDGLPALQAINDGLVPDLILCDWEMDKMDGDVLLAKLNNVQISIPFVMVSSRDIDRFRNQIMQQGAVELLGKPFDAQKLKNIADPILGLRND